MQRFKTKWMAILFTAILLISGISFADQDNLIFNGDFSIYSEDAMLPAGWDFVAYRSDSDSVFCTFEQNDSSILIENIVPNDARVVQTVQVEPDTVYDLTCDISTIDVYGDLGATVAIDNYEYDGTYCYSDPLFDTNDWTHCSLKVKSGPKQTEFTIALRLGGYSMDAEGVAYYKNVKLFPAEDTAGYVDITKDTNVSQYYTAKTESNKSDTQTSNTDALVKIILISLLIAILSFFLFKKEESLTKEPINKTIFAILIAISVLLRILCSIIFVGHSTDINCFMAWGNAVYSNPISQFYTSGMFADYPPLYMYVCGLITSLCHLFGMQYGTTGYVLMFKLPAIIADIMTSYFVYRIATKQGITKRIAQFISLLIAFNPASVFISGGWGQIDSILTLLVVIVIFSLQNNKRVIAGFIFGIAILLKPQALMFGPIIAVMYFIDIYKDSFIHRILMALVSVVTAVASILIISLPFKGSQNFFWIIDKYISTANSYAYASIEAFNFASLIGGNWKDVENFKVLGLSYKLFGSICMILSIGFSAFLLIKSYKKNKAALYLTSGILISLIFTFGHYMHERYLYPVLLLIMVGYILLNDKRLLACFFSYTVSISFNAFCAMYIVDHQMDRGTLYNSMTFFGSLLTVLTTVYFVYVSVSILLNDKIVSFTKKKTNHIIISKPIIEKSSEYKLKFEKTDWIVLSALTLIYAVVALLNLGTTKSPETFWNTTTYGDTISVSVPEGTHISQFWVYPNIGNDGSILISDENGNQSVYEQKYDSMFRWTAYDTDLESDTINISLYSGEVKLNEIAFFDDEGKYVPVQVINATENQNKLFDEQDTVPEYPSYFNGMYFDELYHGRTAYEHLHNLTPYENSHPPLGKIFIMLGILIFGMNPFGWRVVGAFFGIGMIPIMYLFGKRIFKNRWDYSLVLSGLFAFDFMHFTQTRIATIDVYAVFFILLMYYFMYQYISISFYDTDLKKTLKPLALSGLFFGLGAASKWICLYAGAGLAILFFNSIITRYKEFHYYSVKGSTSEKKQVSVFWNNTFKTCLWCVLFFLIIPFTIYYLSYLPYYIYESGTKPGYGLKDSIDTFINYQEFMFNYHSGLTATHPYQSSFWQWPFTMKPMWYYYGGNINNTISTLTASGNPSVWWISTIGAVALLIMRLSGKIDKNKCLQIFLVGVLANYLPWVLVTRCTFIYHFFATVPFILMATVYLLYIAEEKTGKFKSLKWIWLVLCIAFFVLLYPGLSGLRIPMWWAGIIKNLPGGMLMYGA